MKAIVRLALILSLGCVLAATRANAQMCVQPPTSQLGDNLTQFGHLDYSSSGIKVFNLYWSNNWDDAPDHQPVVSPTGQILKAGFLKKDIDAATQALINSNFFDKAKQYGNYSYAWQRGVGPSFPCPDAPSGSPTIIDAMGMASCMEAYPNTGIPNANGVPTSIASGLNICGGCGIAPPPFDFPCFSDPGCQSVQNPTGDLLINIFFPHSTHLGGLDWCGSTLGMHLQVPSEAKGFPLFPLIGTQARPIYITIIPLECYDDINDAMQTVSHEMVEALTNPFPFSFWTRESGPAGSNEPSDICGIGQKTGALLPWTSSSGPTKMYVDSYWSNSDHGCVSVDGLPPTTNATISPPPNGQLWNKTDVTVSLCAIDEPRTAGPSGVQSLTFETNTGISTTTVPSNTASFGVSWEGVTTMHYHATDNLGHVESDHQMFIMIDKTLPTISVASWVPAPNQYGWNNAPFTVTFQCADALSGIRSCASPIFDPIQEILTVSPQARDNADNVGAISLTLQLDTTAPVISYQNNQGTYTVADQVNIQCVATDSLSGVRDASGCQNIVGPAFAFGVGTTTVTGTAIDYADNVGTGSTSFNVVVTPLAVIQLVQRFVTNTGVATSLSAKIQAAADAGARGQSQAKANDLRAFLNELNAQVGKAIATGDADILRYVLTFL